MMDVFSRTDIVLFCDQVQSKVTLKYDSWHKEVLSKFGSMLGNEMAEFHSQVSKVIAVKKILKKEMSGFLYLFACFALPVYRFVGGTFVSFCYVA